MKEIEVVPKVLILASGSGSTAEAFIHATQNGVVNARVGLVVANSKNAGIFDRVARMNAQYGLEIKTAVVNGVTHPEGVGEKGEQTLAESAKICRLAQGEGVALVALMGYMKKVRGDLLRVYGAQPEHTSIHQARMVNTHPGPLPDTRGLFGIHVQEAVLERGLGHSAQTLHIVAEGYDTGPVIAEHRVPVIEGDDAESLFESVQLAEKANIGVDIGNFLKDQADYYSSLTP